MTCILVSLFFNHLLRQLEGGELLVSQYGVSTIFWPHLLVAVMLPILLCMNQIISRSNKGSLIIFDLKPSFILQLLPLPHFQFKSLTLHAQSKTSALYF